MIDIAQPPDGPDDRRFRYGLDIATLTAVIASETLLEPLSPTFAQEMPQEPIPGQALRTPILLDARQIVGGWVVTDGPTEGWPAGWVERLWRVVMNAVGLPGSGVGVVLGVAEAKPLPGDLAATRLVPLMLVITARQTRVRFVIDVDLLWYLADCGFRQGWQHRCRVGRVMPISEQPITGEGYGALPLPGGEIPLATFDDVASWANDAFLTWRMLDRRCGPTEMAKLLSLAFVLDPEVNDTPKGRALYADLQRTRVPLLIQETAADWWQCLRIQWANWFCPEAMIPVRFLGVPHHWVPASIAGLTVSAAVRRDDHVLGSVAVTLTEHDLALLRRDPRWAQRDPVRVLGLALRWVVRSIHRHAAWRFHLGKPCHVGPAGSTAPVGMLVWTSLVPIPLLLDGRTTTVCALRITADATVVGEWYAAVETPAGAVIQAPFRVVAGAAAPDQPRPSSAPAPTPHTPPAASRPTDPSPARPATGRGALWYGLATGLAMMLVFGWWVAGFVGNDGWAQLGAGAGAATALMLVAAGVGMGLRPAQGSRGDRFLAGLCQAFLVGFVLAGLGGAMSLFCPLRYRILVVNPGTAPATMTIDGRTVTVAPGSIRDMPIRHWVQQDTACTLEHAGRVCLLDRESMLLAHIGNRGAVGVNARLDGPRHDAAAKAWATAAAAAMAAGRRIPVFGDVDRSLPAAIGPGLYAVGQPDTFWTIAHGDVSSDKGTIRLISLDPPGDPLVFDSYWELPKAAEQASPSRSSP